eukprot:CAMPEP_0197464996 /NCGR_PEP_ID=MMETSP1175-20131217/64312_1 /TAXON_ID=1003142 /ORGANISM="Triceratium dubium, Strain CCMP147" /LENGTH=940 /DNA_ID=CAMNT_0043001001 /DNA_START=220 /DNA_END=3045 /DNA_ORIENTATION=-
MIQRHRRPPSLVAAAATSAAATGILLLSSLPETAIVSAAGTDLNGGVITSNGAENSKITTMIQRHRRPPSLVAAATAAAASTAILLLLSSTPKASAAGTDLNGGVITVTDVSDRALISEDISDMFSLLQEGKYNDARNIYLAGKNSPMYDKDGNRLAQMRTLSGLSTAATSGKFDGEPPFAAHVYGLAGGDCDGSDEHLTYAHRVVEDLFQEEKGTLPAEAARALNLWMYATHELYDGVEDCAAFGVEGVNPEAAGLADNGNGAYAFEEFMAFWIGHDQAPGSKEGYGLYAMAQEAAEEFGTVDSGTGEANVNSELKKLFVEMQGVTSLSNACRPGSDTAGKLWSIAHRMVSRMTVPLLQMLLKAMNENDTDRVRLYARAIVPQMSRCRPSVFRRLKEGLVDRPYDASKYLQLLGDLQNSFDCLGVSCEDVGAFRQTQIPQCAGFPKHYPIAEYSPSTDVHQHAKIDLDVAELKLLLCFGSERSYEMAKRLYSNGHNSRKTWVTSEAQYLSLEEMATSETKEQSPWATHYVQYHQDKHWADKIITETLSGRGKWGSAPKAQRAEMVAKTAQYQVVFPYLLGEMADALADCSSGQATDNDGSVHSWDEVVAYYVGAMEGTSEERAEMVAKTAQYQVVFPYLLGEMADALADCSTGQATDNDGSVHSWDEVVAYYVGAMEGTSEGGSSDFADGQLMWNLGNKRCTQFGTENSAGWSQVMAAVEDLFYSGKGELDAYDCKALGRTVGKIEHLSLIPLFQSVVRYAIKNEKHGWDSSSKDLAEGEAFALSVLPILAAYDPVGQAIVEENMILAEGREPVLDGAQAVADAFHGVSAKFGLGCQYIGESDGVDFCRMTRRSGGSRTPAAGAAVASLLTAVGLGLVSSVWFWDSSSLGLVRVDIWVGLGFGSMQPVVLQENLHGELCACSLAYIQQTDEPELLHILS